jgi:hypothetical protein
MSDGFDGILLLMADSPSESDEYNGETVKAVDILFNRISGVLSGDTDRARALIDMPGFVKSLMLLTKRCRSIQWLHETGLGVIHCIASLDWPDVKVTLICHGIHIYVLDILQAQERSSLLELEMVRLI